MTSPKPKLFQFQRTLAAATGFNLVEVTLTLGIMSFGMLSLVPLLAVGLKAARLARDDRASAQIAQSLIEAQNQGTLGLTNVYLDEQGAPCRANHAAFTVQPAIQSISGSATRLTLCVTPIGAPDHARVYAVVLPATAP